MDVIERIAARNALFARSWPQGDWVIPRTFDIAVAPLPVFVGHPALGTAGGFSLAIPAHSAQPEAALEFLRFMASADVQTCRVATGGLFPALRKVAQRPEAAEVAPRLDKLAGVCWMPRPTREYGDFYPAASNTFAEGVQHIQQSEDAALVLPQLEAAL